jgi:microcystin degradation protein MlrC
MGKERRMRLALIQVGQESDTFTPLLTTMRNFEAFGVYEGAQILEKLRGVGTVGGYLSVVEAPGVDVETVPVTRGWAGAGGRITTEARLYFEDRIRKGLKAAGKVDGLAIQLHGACSAEDLDDVEGRQLAICREVLGDAVPIVLTLDHHANVTQAMIDGCDALVGFRTQPHDPFETGAASTRLLLRVVAGEVKPTMAWRKLRLISHQEQYLTSGGPMKRWFDQAREHERDPRVLTISNFPMQPWLDVEEGGWSTVVVTDGDQALAERLADEMADLAWSMRAEFQHTTSIPPDSAVRAAEEAAGGIVVLSDTGDSVFGGSPGDSTVLLESMLRVGIRGRALVPLVDATAVAVLADAGEGAVVTLPVGGGRSGFFRPVEVTGTVRRVAAGQIDIGDLFQHEFDMGRTVVLDLGAVTLLISELPGIGGNHPDVYRAFGVEPAEHKMAVLKTASNFQYFAPLTSQVIRVNTPGPTQSDIRGLTWQRVPRPMYPLDDAVPSWRG